MTERFKFGAGFVGSVGGVLGLVVVGGCVGCGVVLCGMCAVVVDMSEKFMSGIRVCFVTGVGRRRLAIRDVTEMRKSHLETSKN